jgi:SAM-dependent methyltransferase
MKNIWIIKDKLKDKHHWYDGWFYDILIAPNQDKLFGQIKGLIEPNSTIIDIGCGTGRLAFVLGAESKSVLGIDLSKRNINRANMSLIQKPNDKISFKHSNLTGIINDKKTFFDYAVLTYVIHEIGDEERIDLLNEAAKVADKIIIGDYVVPKPKGFKGLLSESIEFFAGREHYKNYKSYMAKGGIHHLRKKVGLNVIHEILNRSSTNHILILSR